MPIMLAWKAVEAHNRDLGSGQACVIEIALRQRYSADAGKKKRCEEGEHSNDYSQHQCCTLMQGLLKHAGTVSLGCFASPLHELSVVSCKLLLVHKVPAYLDSTGYHHLITTGTRCVGQHCLQATAGIDNRHVVHMCRPCGCGGQSVHAHRLRPPHRKCASVSEHPSK